MKRVALYVRVSTQEQAQHGLSVDSQITALKQYVNDNGYEEVGLYNDAGFSASKSYKHRPALQQLLSDCQKGKIDLIIFTKLDRWFRNVADYYECQKVLDDNSVKWRAIWEDYETETSSGVFKVNIMLSIAQAESQRTSERIKAVNEYRRAKGDFVGGLAPVGYRVQNKALAIDPDTQEGVKAFFDTYLMTFSPKEAMDSAEAKGVHISRPQAVRMVRSEVYSGNAYGYPCEAYISKEDQQRLIESMEGRRYRTVTQHEAYLFSGILRCPECGGTMTSHLNVCTVHGKKYRYKSYKCSRHNLRRGCGYNKTIFESTLEKYVLSELDSLIEAGSASADVVAEGSNCQAQIDKLQAKLKRIGTRFEDGDITVEEYREKRDSIKAEIKKLEAIHEDRPLIQLPANWHDIYNGLDAEHKKSFWKSTLKRIVKTDKGFDITLL